MRLLWVIIGIMPCTQAASSGFAQQTVPARQLIREVVNNELQDHNSHGFWRYWVRQRTDSENRLVEEVETNDGPIKLVVSTNGHPPDLQTRDEEQSRLARLIRSPQDQASHRRAYEEDEHHIALVMQMLPEAFVFEDAGIENDCRHLRYRPDPAYIARTIEARIIHSMAGDVWIDARTKRLSRLDGHLDDNIDFGFGLLGRIDRGGWFRIQRQQVSPSEWKTIGLEVHLNGRAILFKCIARETSEVRGGFTPVPRGTTIAEGVKILRQTDPESLPGATAHVSPLIPSRMSLNDSVSSQP